MIMLIQSHTAGKHKVEMIRYNQHASHTCFSSYFCL